MRDKFRVILISYGYWSQKNRSHFSLVRHIACQLVLSVMITISGGMKNLAAIPIVPMPEVT